MDWDELIPSETDGYSALDLQQLPVAVGWLKEDFGIDFLRAGKEQRHPILRYFVNRAPWTRQWFVQFAHAVRIAKSWDNWESLHGRLKKPATFQEGLEVLRVGVLLNRAGFQVKVDPVLVPSSKIPDLVALSPTSEQVFVEVSALGPSHLEIENQRKFQAISMRMWAHHDLIQCGRFDRYPSDERLNEILGKLDKMARKARQDQSIEELEIPGILVMALAPSDKRVVLEAWAKQRGIDVGTFSGPSTKTEILGRLVQKITVETKQLPEPHAALLWLVVDQLQARKDLVSAIPEIGEFIHRYPNLLGIMLEMNQSSIITAADDKVSSRRSWGLEGSQLHFVRNEFATTPVSLSTYTRLDGLE